MFFSLCLDNDMVTMYEEAYKKQPGNEDLGAQTFFANVRASQWKSAHNVRFFFDFVDKIAKS